MNKAEILERLESEREKFLDVIDGLSELDLQRPGVIGDWSVKDILAHLSRWEAELVKLLFQAQHGQKPSSAHFTQKDVDKTNRTWYEESRIRSLHNTLEDFHAVRNQTILRVEEFSNQDLSTAGRFPWSKDRPLAEWIAADSYEHEAEHAAQVAAWRLEQKI